MDHRNHKTLQSLTFLTVYISWCGHWNSCFRIPNCQCFCSCAMCSVMSDSLWPYGPYVTLRLLCPWGFPGKNTGVGCHFRLQRISLIQGSDLLALRLLHCRFFTLWAIREAPFLLILPLKILGYILKNERHTWLLVKCKQFKHIKEYRIKQFPFVP